MRDLYIVYFVVDLMLVTAPSSRPCQFFFKVDEVRGHANAECACLTGCDR